MKRIILFVLLAMFVIAIAETSPSTPAESKHGSTGEVKEKLDSTSILYDWQNRVRPIPDEYVFQTKYLGGTQIIFNHKKHVTDFKLECIRCHHVESCKHCHQKEVKPIDISESKVALHENCFACHKNMSCVECHKR